MFQYLSKFLIQILPSVTATVIGGFIVHTWIMPKAATDTPRPAIAAKAAPDAESKPVNVKGIAMPAKDAATKETAAKDVAAKDVPARETASARPSADSGDKADDVKPRGASEAPAAEPRHAAKPAAGEKAPVAEKSNSTEKSAAATSDRPKSVDTPAPVADVAATQPADDKRADDKRNATDLARTALERLRAGEQPRNDHVRAAAVAKPAAETQTVELHRVQPQPAADPVQIVAPQPVTLPMGPPINIATPRYSEVTMSDPDREDDARVVPPGEIPTAHRTADTPEGRTTIADDFVSATRSMFRAVLPR